MSKPGQIKKMNLHYAKCPAGDLHNGEIMNLVCVDSNCHKRGLICPICRMNNHEEHYILPLKVFLEEIKKLFVESDDSESLNNLSDYLRSLENSRKELLSILRQSAESIANEFRSIEQKLQENYVAVRRNVLAQSSISTKLPNFIELLVQNQEKDAYALQEEFQKYSELIKFENDKMTISDKAKKIVSDYSETPKQMKAVLDDQVKSIQTSFKDLLSSNKAKVVKKNSEGYVFSTENKSSEITLTDDNKKIITQPNLEDLGLAYIKEGAGEGNRKITFQILQATSLSITLGMGFPETDKQLAFIYGSPVKDKHFIAHISGYNQIYGDEEEDVSQPEKDNFTFEEVGAKVTVSFEGDKNRIVFSKQNSEITRVVPINLSEEEKKKLQFFVVMGESDQVKIVDQ